MMRWKSLIKSLLTAFALMLALLSFSPPAYAATPAKPKISSVKFSKGKVTVKWSGKKAEFYKVYKSVGKTFYKVAETKKKSWTDTTPGIGSVKYQVVGVNGKKTSAKSATKDVTITDKGTTVKIGKSVGVTELKYTLPPEYAYAKDCKVEVIRWVNGTPKKSAKTVYKKTLKHSDLTSAAKRTFTYKDDDPLMIGCSADYTLKVTLNCGHDKLKVTKTVPMKNVAMNFDIALSAKAVKGGIELTTTVPMCGVYGLHVYVYDPEGEMVDQEHRGRIGVWKPTMKHVLKEKPDPTLNYAVPLKKGYTYGYELGGSTYNYLGTISFTSEEAKVTYR